MCVSACAHGKCFSGKSVLAPVPCLQVVLAGYSPYLRAMFTNGMLESGRDMVDIHTHTHKHTNQINK